MLACILNSSKTILAGLSRTVIYFPVTISAVVIGYVWKMVFDYNYGIVAKLLEFVGRSDLIAPWLGQESTVMLCVCTVSYTHLHVPVLLIRTEDGLIPLSKELEHVNLYVKLQQERFENHFQFTLEVDESVAPSSIYVMKLLLQPLVRCV